MIDIKLLAGGNGHAHYSFQKKGHHYILLSKLAIHFV